MKHGTKLDTRVLFVMECSPFTEAPIVYKTKYMHKVRKQVRLEGQANIEKYSNKTAVALKSNIRYRNYHCRTST